MLRCRLLLTAVLLAACGDERPAVEREPNPARAQDAQVRADAQVLDASGLSIGRADGAAEQTSPDDSGATTSEGTYPACGGFAGLACPDGEFCSQEGDDGLGCGFADSLGTCSKTAEVCPAKTAVCGCDGVSYESRCAAHAAGSSVAKLGACQNDRELNCDERDVLCKRARPKCTDGLVPSVVEGCWAACVAIAECVCHEADDCPQREQYVCHMHAQHCGPYVN